MAEPMQFESKEALQSWLEKARIKTSEEGKENFELSFAFLDAACTGAEEGNMAQYLVQLGLALEAAHMASAIENIKRQPQDAARDARIENATKWLHGLASNAAVKMHVIGDMQSPKTDLSQPFPFKL